MWRLRFHRPRSLFSQTDPVRPRPMQAMARRPTQRPPQHRTAEAPQGTGDGSRSAPCAQSCCFRTRQKPAREIRSDESASFSKPNTLFSKWPMSPNQLRQGEHSLEECKGRKRSSSAASRYIPKRVTVLPAYVRNGDSSRKLSQTRTNVNFGILPDCPATVTADACGTVQRIDTLVCSTVHRRAAVLPSCARARRLPTLAVTGRVCGFFLSDARDGSNSNAA